MATSGRKRAHLSTDRPWILKAISGQPARGGAAAIAIALPLVIGFAASAIANRLDFALWALLSAAICATIVRTGKHAVVVLCGGLGVSLLALAFLFSRHRDSLVEGLAAFSVPAPLWQMSRPALPAIAGLLALVVGATLELTARRSLWRRRPGGRSQ